MTAMNEITVKATKILFYHKGDTLVYNADGFINSKGSMLEELINSLPGVNMDEFGHIRVNGEYVSSLLINGRDFFKGEPQVALQNLPSYTVDKIKVFRKIPFNAYLTRGDTSVIARKDDPLVMDIRLKKQYAKGWLANVEVAGGKGDSESETLYNVRLFGLHYDDLRTLGSYASTNNLSETNSLQGKSWSTGKGKEGEYISQTVGSYMSGQNQNKKLQHHTTVHLNNMHNKDERFISNISFLPNNHMDSRNHSIVIKRQTNVNLNHEMNIRSKNFNLRFWPRIYFSRSNNNSRDYSAIFSDGRDELHRGAILDSIFHSFISPGLDSTLLNYRTRQTLTKAHFLRGASTLDMDIKLPYVNKILSINMLGSFEHKRGIETQEDYIFYYKERHGHSQMADDNRPDFNYKYEISARYTLLNVQRKKNRWTLDLSLKHQEEYHSNDRTRLFQDSIVYLPLTTLPSFTIVEPLLDTENSFHSIEKKHQNTINVRFGYRHSQVWSCNLSFPFENINESVIDDRNSENTRLTRNKWFLCPAFSVGIYNLSMSFNYTILSPHLVQLLKIQDTSNPMSLVFGNSSLRDRKEYSVNIFYRKFWFSQRSNLNANIRYYHRNDDFGYKTLYNKQTGAKTISPDNINGNWGVNSYFEFDAMIGRSQKVQLSNRSEVRYIRSRDYMNNGSSEEDLLQTVNNYSLTDNLKLTYRFGTRRIGLQMSGAWNHYFGQQYRISTIKYLDLHYGLTIYSPIGKNYDINMDISVQRRYGYMNSSFNDNNLLWNLSASYVLGRDGNWIVKLSGYDLLHQVSNVRHYVNVQGQTETWYNTSPAYLMMHLIYRFDIKPKKNVELR